MTAKAKISNAPAKRGRPSGRSAAETRAMLIKAAERHFNSRPYPDVSMEQIAKTAGFSGPAIYNHFASKDDLFMAAIKQRMFNYNRTISQAVAIDGSWKDKFGSLLDAVRPLQGPESGFQTISGAVMNRLRDNPAKFDELRDLREESAAVFRGLVKEATQCGDLPENLDPIIAGDLLMAMTVGAINTVSFYHPEASDMDAIFGAFKGLLHIRN
ncbi:MAG: TetR/AcrR family transcriptional regulator [Marinomonas sp.]